MKDFLKWSNKLNSKHQQVQQLCIWTRVNLVKNLYMLISNIILNGNIGKKLFLDILIAPESRLCNIGTR